MTKFEKTVMTLIAISIVMTLGTFVLLNKPHTVGGVSNYIPTLTNTQGNASCVANTSTLLLATSTAGRPEIYVSNASAYGVFIGPGSASAYKGIYLAASSTMLLDQGAVYQGAWYCYALGNTATVSYEGIN